MLGQIRGGSGDLLAHGPDEEDVEGLVGAVLSVALGDLLLHQLQENEFWADVRPCPCSRMLLCAVYVDREGSKAACTCFMHKLPAWRAALASHVPHVAECSCFNRLAALKHFGVCPLQVLC